MMKIAIVGAGAMGCLYGAKLSTTEHEVWLLDVMEAHIDAINQQGLRVMETNGEGVEMAFAYTHLKATIRPEEAGPADLALIFVKSTMTRQAIMHNKPVFGPNTVILTLQNGLGNIESIQQIESQTDIIAGTTAHGASMISPGVIRHSGVGKTIIGELSGDLSSRIVNLAGIFNSADLSTEVSRNVIGLIWDKLLVNVGINALTAITGLKNGGLLANRHTEELLELAVSEAQKVGLAKGITFNFTDPVAHAKEICLATAENTSSMLQDIKNQRRTEIDQINGAIVREGKLLNIDTPVNQVLYNLVKIKEADYE